MKKVLVFNGSPKPVSDTMVITNAFLDGLKECGRYEIEIINVIEKKIAPCRGCLRCWQNGNGECVIRDDQNEMLRKIIDSDIILYSFPLYCYSMPSHLKALVDRLIPLSKMNMAADDERVHHTLLKDLSQKRYIILSGCGFPNWKDNFAALRIICKNLFHTPVTVCIPEAPMMNVPEAVSVTEPLKEKLRAAGREYTESGTLSGETINLLETPMIPAETYIAIVNGNAQ